MAASSTSSPRPMVPLSATSFCWLPALHGAPACPAPVTPVGHNSGGPVGLAPGTPVGPSPGGPVSHAPGGPVSHAPGGPVGPAPGTPVGPNPGGPVGPSSGGTVGPAPGTPVGPSSGGPALVYLSAPCSSWICWLHESGVPLCPQFLVPLSALAPGGMSAPCSRCHCRPPLHLGLPPSSWCPCRPQLLVPGCLAVPRQPGTQTQTMDSELEPGERV
jgi:hypothetical protein